VRHRRSFSTATCPRPDDGDITAAVDHVHAILDTAVTTLVLLSPDTTAWAAPAAAVDAACWADDRFVRAHRRVQEVEDRIRRAIHEKHHPDLDDLHDAVQLAVSDAAEIGWKLGVSVIRRSVGVA
jgi:hypothetical protein